MQGADTGRHMQQMPSTSGTEQWGGDLACRPAALCGPRCPIRPLYVRGTAAAVQGWWSDDAVRATRDVLDHWRCDRQQVRNRRLGIWE
jgi:hypothetical protein